MTEWIKISEFDPALFEGEEFLVAIKLPDDDVYLPFLAQWARDMNENGQLVGPARFQGDWRNVYEWSQCEPAAFARIELYDPEEDEPESIIDKAVA